MTNTRVLSTEKKCKQTDSCMSTENKKRLNLDLGIIAAVTVLAMGIYMLFRGRIEAFINSSSNDVLIKTGLFAAMSFMIAGLGTTIVSAMRREKLSVHGIRTEGALTSILLSAIGFIPLFSYRVAAEEFSSYSLFGNLSVGRELMASSFGVGATGMILLALTLGLVGGYNLVFVSDKINERFPTEGILLDRGALISTVLFLTVFGKVFGLGGYGVVGAVIAGFAVYSMLVVRHLTGNAWGTIVALTLLMYSI
jgi:hypothetical protein